MSRWGSKQYNFESMASDTRPLYLRLREEIASRILDGEIGDGDALPSVRSLSAETGANPLTVAKAYRSLIETGIATIRRGRGLYLATGGTEQLKTAERARFLREDWPKISAQMHRLNIDPSELLEALLPAHPRSTTVVRTAGAKALAHDSPVS